MRNYRQAAIAAFSAVLISDYEEGLVYISGIN